MSVQEWSQAGNTIFQNGNRSCTTNAINLNIKVLARGILFSIEWIIIIRSMRGILVRINTVVPTDDVTRMAGYRRIVCPTNSV